MTLGMRSKLLALWPQPESLQLCSIAQAIEQMAADFGVDRPLRLAHFVAQTAHESRGFQRLEENLSYSASRIAEVFPKLAARAHLLAYKPEQLGNAAYANRFGNGDEPSGDGYRYRARGPIGLTFRDNYSEQAADLGLNLIGEPKLAALPAHGVRIALNYWKKRGCNEAADQDNVGLVTRRINGGINGLAERIRLTNEAKKIFADPPPQGGANTLVA